MLNTLKKQDSTIMSDVLNKKRLDSKVKELIKDHLKVLKSLQYSSGLFAASSKKVSTGYDKCWLRDNFYECLAFVELNDWETVKKTYEALFKIFLKHEYKIDWAIQRKPEHKHEYIHARYNPDTFDEFWEDWGNKQNDAVGAILFMIGELEKRNQKIIDTPDKKRVLQKLVHYLESIQYWHDKDSGMWEEDEEIHASSVGACVAGLNNIKNIVHVKPELIKKGKDTLKKLLPRESQKKFVDLAQLSLIYPYNITTPKQTKAILENIEYYLVKRMGVIRYKNDYYYNANSDGHSQEAEWTMGLSWIAIIYKKLGNTKKAIEYFGKSLKTIHNGEIPELYYSNSMKPNENSPLGWAESLFIVAIHRIAKKHTH
ncbi:glycoside hydrolase family 15 [Candidatus Woesearchaeota archaeon]|nr:glycoside hydrolase family 15 [Candidatus Woesearchaeota archaeon]